MRKINISLSSSGVQTAINEIKAYEQYVKNGTKMLLDLLAAEGESVARTGYLSAVYDGTKDVTVTSTKEGDNTRWLIAVGASVLFIEFGTGVKYPDSHPDARALGMNRGEYGMQKGSRQSGWTYKGETGSNGKVVSTNENGENIVRTYGNPASMTMYNTHKYLSDRLYTLAKRCFT